MVYQFLLLSLSLCLLFSMTHGLLRECLSCFDPLLGLPVAEHVYLEGFNYDIINSTSDRTELYQTLAAQAKSFHKVFDGVWIPPISESADTPGYVPTKWYSLRNRKSLKSLVKALHKRNILVLTDINLNHRMGTLNNTCSHRLTNFEKPYWSNEAVVRNDLMEDGVTPFVPNECNPSLSVDTGDNFVGAPDIDHTNRFVRYDIIDFLYYLREEVGIDGWRYNFVRGYDPVFLRAYNYYANPTFVFGDLDQSVPEISRWVRGAGGEVAATDYPLRNALNKAISSRDYTNLTDFGSTKRPNGYIGMNPSMAVTFVDNHETLQSDAFANGDENSILQAYVYILTHPGTPVVFWNHWQTPQLAKVIKRLIALRKYFFFTSYGRLAIDESRPGLYSAYLGRYGSENECSGQMAIKLGPEDWEPCGGHWDIYEAGDNFKVWIVSRN